VGPKSDSQLKLLASLNRLRAWSPGRGAGSDDIFGPDLDHDAQYLRRMLSLWDKAISARIVDPVAYAEYASLLLQRLDTTTPEGLAEARRVLRKNLEIFDQVRRSQPLIPEHEELRQELLEALGRAEK
jgi:predicted nucleic acid-binding protein